MKKIDVILTFILCGLILAFSIRGEIGNPIQKNLENPKFKDEGALELSPERGRFALTYSLVEDKSFQFSLPVARFIVPDLGYVDGKYVSLFAPGVSFLSIPGYILGKYLNITEVGVFAIIALFALLNSILIRLIAIKLGANNIAATIGAILFLFASPAYSYAITLYQHHISTFLILSSVYVLVRFKSIWSLTLIWLLFAASIPLDYPNLFFMFPIALCALGRIIFLQHNDGKLTLNLKLAGFFTFLTAIFPVIFLLWFNLNSYGNSLQASGTIPSVKAIDEQGYPKAPDLVKENVEKYINPEIQQKSLTGFFKTRNITRGFTTQLFSFDRGIVVFTPVMLFGFIGIIYAYRRRIKLTSLFLTIILANFILYAMWGDPWGGWSFGSRYLIPSYAILSIFIAFALTKYSKNLIFLVIFFIISIYSICVNTLGALTTNQNPPKNEAIELEKAYGVPQKYTFLRNWDYIYSNKSKSFIYQTYANKYINALTYYSIIISTLVLLCGSLITISYLRSRKESKYG